MHHYFAYLLSLQYIDVMVVAQIICCILDYLIRVYTFQTIKIY